LMYGAFFPSMAGSMAAAPRTDRDELKAANGVTARYLVMKGLPSVRRVLRVPKRWDRVVALAAGTGERLPATPDATVGPRP